MGGGGGPFHEWYTALRSVLRVRLFVESAYGSLSKVLFPKWPWWKLISRGN